MRLQLNGLNISAIQRSANRVAQKLALYAMDISEDISWMEDFPNCVRGLVDADTSILSSV